MKQMDCELEKIEKFVRGRGISSYKCQSLAEAKGAVLIFNDSLTTMSQLELRFDTCTRFSYHGRQSQHSLCMSFE